jgi:putative ABC transport system permease protein
VNVNTLRLAFTLARREMRSGLGGFRLFLACLALGVAAIAAILSFSRAVQEGLRADARELLGGDVAMLAALSRGLAPSRSPGSASRAS